MFVAWNRSILAHPWRQVLPANRCQLATLPTSLTVDCSKLTASSVYFPD